MKTASRVVRYIIFIFLLCLLINIRAEARKRLPTYYMLTGETKKIPVSFHEGHYYYHSENLKVLQFTENGDMIAIKSGNAVVMLSYFTPDNKQIKKFFKVSVHSKVKKLKWKNKTGSLNVGEEFDYKVKYKAASGKNISFKWSSSNPQVATVDKKGHVNAVSKGTTWIKCKVVGQRNTSVKIKLKVNYTPVKKIDFQKTSICIKPGAFYNINDKVTVYPEDATNKLLETVSENTNIIEVSYGIIHAVGYGSTKVIIKATDGSECRKEIEVNVVDYVGRDEIHYVAHRGLSTEAPENTVKAFKLAGEQGFFAVETDLKLSKDRQFVISHDDNLIRMCGVNMNIADATYDEIRSMPIIAGANYKKYMNDSEATTIPTLSDYLGVCNTYGMVPMIEIKFPEGDDSLTEDNVLYRLMTDVESYMGNREVYIISFYSDSIRNLSKIKKEMKADNIKLCLLLGRCENKESIEMYQFCKDNNICISIDGTSNPELIKNMAADDIEVGMWTINDIGDVREMYNWGVDFVVTDKILWGE